MLQSQEATDLSIISGMISSHRGNEEMVKLSGCENIKETDTYIHPSCVFKGRSLCDECAVIVSWCHTGAMSDREVYSTFLTNSQQRSRKQANIAVWLNFVVQVTVIASNHRLDFVVYTFCNHRKIQFNEVTINWLSLKCLIAFKSRRTTWISFQLYSSISISIKLTAF